MKPERVEKALEEINQQREDLNVYIERKQQEIAAVEQDKLNCETIRFIIENFDTAYNEASKEQKKKLIQSMVKEVKLGYLGDSKKVIPLSMTLKITGEQIELFHENNGDGGDLGLSQNSDECCVLLQRADGKVK